MEHFDLVIMGAGWFGLVMGKTYRQVHPEARIILLDDAKSIGGVFAKERLYPSLLTNNLGCGTFQYSDFPMTEERFGVQPNRHIPGCVVHEYLLQYAQEFNLLPHIRLQSKAETAEMKEDGTWFLSILENDTGRKYSLQASKIVFATGLMSDPFIPQFEGSAEFKAPIFHLKELGQHAQHISSDALKNVVVIGASKSAWDACYLYATRGVQVQWVIRASGFGPIWMARPHVTPFKIYLEYLLWTRLVTWFSPCIWGAADGWIKRSLHGTWLGRKIVSGFWFLIAQDVIGLTGYDKHPETKKLKSWNHPFWGISSTSALNYDQDYMELVRNGSIKVHIADIIHLSCDRNVHLSDGKTLPADALVYTTGWKYRPPLEILPKSLSLGLPTDVGGSTPLTKWADKEIVDQLPVLKDGPQRNPIYAPMKSSSGKDTQPSQPYRLYRFLVPPSQVLKNERTVAFLGAHHAVSKIPIAQLQALWLTAFFDGKITGLQADQITQEEIDRQTILHSQFGKWRYPAAGGGKGERYPELALEALPYVDMLLKDLGMNFWRKKSWWRNYVTPYTSEDYKGLVEEWMDVCAQQAARDKKLV